MTDLRNFGNSIRRGLSNIEASLEQEGLVMGKDLVALIANRVVQKGEKTSGGSFTPYSDQYAKTRSKRNLNTSPKNFMFTGEMWRKTDVVSSEVSGDVMKIQIGAKNKLTALKIAGNSSREGESIISASKKEVEIVTRAFGNRILKKLI